MGNYGYYANDRSFETPGIRLDEAILGFELEQNTVLLDDGSTLYTEAGMLRILLGSVAESGHSGVEQDIKDMAVRAIAAAHIHGLDPGEAAIYLRDHQPDTPIDLFGALVCASERIQDIEWSDNWFETEETEDGLVHRPVGGGA